MLEVCDAEQTSSCCSWCSSAGDTLLVVSVNNRFPGNTGSPASAQRQKHAGALNILVLSLVENPPSSPGCWAGALTCCRVEATQQVVSSSSSSGSSTVGAAPCIHALFRTVSLQCRVPAPDNPPPFYSSPPPPPPPPPASTGCLSVQSSASSAALFSLWAIFSLMFWKTRWATA